jgi:hypothetical protein
MSIWAWIQPVDRVWKVVTDSDKGMIKIYNEKDVLISEKRDLEKDAIYLIEETFLKIVATKLVSEDGKIMQNIDSGKVAVVVKKDEYNYMYA